MHHIYHFYPVRFILIYSGIHGGAVCLTEVHIHTEYTVFIVYTVSSACCMSKMTLDMLKRNGRKMGENDILQPNINNVRHFKAFSQEGKHYFICGLSDRLFES